MGMGEITLSLEEVGVSLTDAFREDRKGDRTNLAGSGLYAKDVAKYKCRMKYPLGNSYLYKGNSIYLIVL